MKSVMLLGLLLILNVSIAFSITSPVNVSPSNGTIGTNVGLTLDWSAITGNTGYLYQYDVVSTFDSPLLVSGTTSTNVSEIYVSNLYFGQIYYWRCAAKSAVDTSAWTSTWNFTTTNVISNAAPSIGSTGLAVGVTLDWNGITGNTGYIYQLDTVATFDSPLLVAGNTGASVSELYVSNLYFGQKYYWRAAAKNGVDTSAWTSTWNFTTTNVISNVAPTNGSTGLAVGVTLDWNGITGNTGYLYQLDTVATFDSPLLLAGNTAAGGSEIYVSNLYFGQKYYWRAAAKNAVDTSAWTSTWNFATTDAISNSSPSNGSTGLAVGVTLDWNGITGNTGYLYQLDTVATFDSPLLLAGNTAAGGSEIYVSNLYFGQKYYWRAAAKNGVDTSAWTSTWNFTTTDAISNSSPTNGSTGLAVGLTLDWTTVNGNTGFLYQLDTVATFDSPLLLAGNTAAGGSEIYVSNLYFGQKYYWRAAAKNGVDTSAWTSTWNFTTISTVTNVSPTNQATNIAISPILDWTNMTGNIGYLSEIDTSLNFNSALRQIYTSATNISQYTATGLLYGTTYYWHAAAKSAVDTSSWSSTWSFTTAYELTAAPVLISPANSSVDLSFPSVGIQWAASAGAVTYQYQYSTSPSFATGIISNTTSLVTGSCTGLYPHTVYYWRVRGANANGYSPWSTVWQFTTESADLLPPVLVSPANNATNLLAANLNLDWNSVFGASGYIYEITEDINFVSGITTQTITETNKTIIGLANGTQYFWRVKATDGVVQSDWSEVWNFTTMYFGLAAPVLVSPLSSSVNVDFVAPTLDWNSVSGASEYIYQISTDIGFATLVSTETVTSSQVTLADLLPGTQYFWRVRASNEFIVGSWSQVWNFTTTAETLAAPILVSPADNSVEVDFNAVDLVWNSIFGATQYTWQVSSDNSFVSYVVSGTLLSLTTEITDLLPETLYFWRVMASSGLDESAWSEVWSFTTRLDVGTVNVISSQLNIFPNPSAGIFVVDGESINSVDVLNLAGQLIYSVKANNTNVILDLSEFSSGVYFAKIHTNDGIVTRQLIKE